MELEWFVEDLKDVVNRQTVMVNSLERELV